ncbi:hypothetical protein HG531_005808 [Fusarium graminearum]|nr:hypothetical protein HG531_005808 [Fusarium graminearum]
MVGQLTDISIASLTLRKLTPVNPITLTILLKDTQDILIRDNLVNSRRLTSRLLELTDPFLEDIPLADDIVESITKLVDARLGQSGKNTKLSTAVFITSANNLALILLFSLTVFLCQILLLGLEGSNLLVKVGNLVLNLLSKILCLVDHSSSLLGSILHSLFLFVF